MKKLVISGMCILLVSSLAQAQFQDLSDVTCKEYSDTSDINAFGGADALQTLLWEGDGTVVDGYDYSNGSFDNYQVDALASRSDEYYAGVTHYQTHPADNSPPSATVDQDSLLLSFTGIGDIYGTAGLVHGSPSIIKTAALVNLTPPGGGAIDVDGLELGNQNGLPDADMFSTSGDILGVSVWAYDDGTGISSPYLTQLEIATAIGAPGLAGSIDLDAMMGHNPGGNGWSAGDSIMFSIAPIGSFDGGEIWVWNFGTDASFLYHSGELWDTAHDVKLHFDIDNENINALEAGLIIPIPEPATICLFTLGTVILRKKRNRTKA